MDSVLQQNLQFLRDVHNGADDSCYTAILRNWNDEMDPLYVKYMNDGEYKMYDKLYSIDRFLNKAKRLIQEEAEETYFSLNSFWRKNKATNDVRHLNGFILDYDFYKKRSYKKLSPIEMYEQHIKETLPMIPTYVVDSGRGLYVIYLFAHASIKLIKLYRAIYKQLYYLQNRFGMDAKAMNITQVIRIPGTWNAAAEKEVGILEHNETDYKIFDFCPLLNFSKQQVDAYKRERKSLYKKDKEDKKPNHDKRKASTKLFLKDLEKIIIYKNKQGIKKGYREYLIYLAQERMLWSGYSEEKTLKKSHQLNQMFLNPLFDSEVERRCKPSQIWWNCTSIEKVISGLEIDTKLQQQLCYLQERRIKDLKKKRISNKHPLLNRSKKEVDMLIRRTHVCKLKKEGKSNTEIANILTENKSTITHDLKYIQQNKHEFRKVLAETIESIVAILSDNKKIRSIIYDEQKRLREWLESGVIALSDSS